MLREGSFSSSGSFMQRTQTFWGWVQGKQALVPPPSHPWSHTGQIQGHSSQGPRASEVHPDAGPWPGSLRALGRCISSLRSQQQNYQQWHGRWVLLPRLHQRESHGPSSWWGRLGIFMAVTHSCEGFRILLLKANRHFTPFSHYFGT